MKKFISLFCAIAMCMIVLSSCTFMPMDTPTPMEEMRGIALSCFTEHKSEMEAVIATESAGGEADWCERYSRGSEGTYEFILEQTGFTGTNTRTGIWYCPVNEPGESYVQDKENENVYVYQNGVIDTYYLERIEPNWFFFYDKYDF